MNRVIVPSRYVVFSIFIICNAILCSAAVWNFGIARSLGWNFQIDTYLIFVGASGLALIFTIIFVELARPNAFAGKVWFECVWVGLFWIMELAGAAALTATVPNLMCGPVRFTISASCLSTQVLLGFSWTCTVTLLGYFSLLVISAILQSQQNHRIWQCSVRKFPASVTCGRLSSQPSSPSLPRFTPKAMVQAPSPRRLGVAPVAMYPSRAGLSANYHIENSRPPSPPRNLPAPPIPVAASSRYQSPRNVTDNYSGISFYPQHMQSTLVSQPSRILPPTRPYQLPPSPPPLGDWPRTDAVSQPLRIKRKNNLQPITVPPPTAQAPIGRSPPNFSPSRSRPSGPRVRSSPKDNRPPPLDLSKVSTFREGRHRR